MIPRGDKGPAEAHPANKRQDPLPALADLTIELCSHTLCPDYIHPGIHLELSLGLCVPKCVHNQFLVLKQLIPEKQKGNYKDTNNLPEAREVTRVQIAAPPLVH